MKSSTESCCLPSVAVHNLGQWGPSTYGRCIKFYVIIGSDRSTRWILGKWMDIFGERRRRREEPKSRLSQRLFSVRSRQKHEAFLEISSPVRVYLLRTVGRAMRTWLKWAFHHLGHEALTEYPEVLAMLCIRSRPAGVSSGSINGHGHVEHWSKNATQKHSWLFPMHFSTCACFL